MIQQLSCRMQAVFKVKRYAGISPRIKHPSNHVMVVVLSKQLIKLSRGNLVLLDGEAVPDPSARHMNLSSKSHRRKMLEDIINMDRKRHGNLLTEASA